jgi:hypothetical protein
MARRHPGRVPSALCCHASGGAKRSWTLAWAMAWAMVEGSGPRLIQRTPATLSGGMFSVLYRPLSLS